MTQYNSREQRHDYFFPLLANGDIAVTPNYAGSDRVSDQGFPSGLGVFRAGRRGTSSRLPLILWGILGFDCGEEPVSFTQDFDERAGITTAECVYPGGFSVRAEYFVHPSHNLFAVRRTFTGVPPKAELTLSLDPSMTDAAFSLTHEITADSITIDADIRAYDRYFSRSVLLTDTPSEITFADNRAVFSFTPADGDAVCCYYLLDDSLFREDDAPDYREKLNAVPGFDALQAECSAFWQEYHAEGYVRTGIEAVDNAYATALYHLRCSMTRWSCAIGINNSHWYGKFFPFDEYYAYFALLQSGRADLASRIPEFRLATLPKAIRRATDSLQNPDTQQARFPWTSEERGDEASFPSYWRDHIFHMALVALGAWDYYEFTGDMDTLRRYYPMIRACAKFYTLNCVCRYPDGQAFVWKCADLERLGASVFNPYFSSCGVIRTLEVCAAAAELLGEDEAYRAECLDAAAALRRTLPHDGEKYIPFDGCPQKSIAVFTGTYPFDVIARDDPRQIAAMLDFTASEQGFGNMYRQGKKVACWYACWKAIAFARLGRADLAWENLQQGLSSLGAFSEVWEINEDAVRLRPWFSTAAGVLLTSVNEMLLSCDGKTIDILPAAHPELDNVSFRLLARGGAIVEAEVRDGKLAHLDISYLPTAPDKHLAVRFRGEPLC